MATLTFRSWSRRGGHAILGLPHHGRPVASLPLRATDTTGAEASGQASFALMGPGDVAGLKAGAVSARFPRPGQVDAEAAYYPYVELAEDLPWRYSPRGKDEDGEIQPWLALLVVKPGEMTRSRGRVTVSASALNDQRPSPGSAHVQYSHGTQRSRVLCLRDLDDHSDYVALLVPVFTEIGELRWDGTRQVNLPVYDEWRFRTGEPGTFATLADQLRPADDLGKFGRITVGVGTGADAEVKVRGALTGIDDTTDPPPPLRAAQNLEALVAFDPDHGVAGVEEGHDRDGRRYVRPPTYGQAWMAGVGDGAPKGGWVDQLGGDPTHRVVAGLGLEAAVALQEEIVGAAGERFGATAVANQRIASLSAGLACGRSLWDRRVAPLHRDERIRLLGLGAARVITEGPEGARRSLAAAVAGPGRTLPVGLFSTAAHRVLRRSAARVRVAGSDSVQVLAVANRTRAAVRRPDDIPGDRHHHGVAHADTLVARLVDEMGVVQVGEQAVRSGRELDDALRGFERAGHLPAALDRLGRLERFAPRPADLDAIDEALRLAFDPRADAAAVARVGATISPDDPEPLKPREPCPALDLAAWANLRDRRREWLLPGVHTLEDGEVLSVATNPVFIDAFLVGMNTQALAELRWRNLSVASGCTPLRRFWDRSVSDGADYREASDIVGIREWTTGGPGPADARGLALGHPSHSAAEADRRQLVVVFCTDLFRRYPGTLVYLSPKQGAAGSWSDADLSDPILPSFAARISAKLVLFAFPRPPEEIEDHWVVVEQQPPGFHFDRNEDPGPRLPNRRVRSAATRGAEMMVRPVRVLLAGPTLKAGS